MFPKALNQHRQNDLSRSTVTKQRCQHRTASGRQCRTPLTSNHATLCPRHAAAQRDDSSDLSALLSANLPEKKSATDIHTQLWNLSLALQQGRITPRRAAVLAYINSLLLRTLPVIHKQDFAHPSEPDVPYIVLDMPRPLHDSDDEQSAFPLDPSAPSPDYPSYPTPNSFLPPSPSAPASPTTPTSPSSPTIQSSPPAPSSIKLYGFHPTVTSPAPAISAAPPVEQKTVASPLPSAHRLGYFASAIAVGFEAPGLLSNDNDNSNGSGATQERFFAAQADAFAPREPRGKQEANAEEEASACSAQNDGVANRRLRLSE
jgi:hypothetical protein